MTCPPLPRSQETAVAGRTICGNQWALWRSSGGDRRIRRTGKEEGVRCERWDSRRGSIRHSLPYRAQRGRVNASDPELSGWSGPSSWFRLTKHTRQAIDRVDRMNKTDWRLDIWNLPINRGQPRFDKIAVDLRETTASIKLSDGQG